MNKKDAIGALAFLGIGLFAFVKGYQLPFGSIHAPDMAFMPLVLSAVLILLSLVLLGRSLLSKSRGEDRINLGKHRKRLIPLIAGLVIYGLLLRYLGYMASTLLVILLAAKIADCSWKAAFSVSISCTVLTFILFRVYLQCPLPKGVIPFLMSVY